jgi:hypothetical protein
MYRPPAQAMNIFCDRVEAALCQCAGDTYIVGDINEHFTLSRETTGPIVKFLTGRRNAMGQQFNQIITCATRDSGKIIDHVYTYHDNLRSQVVDCYYSDHYYVTFAIPL